MIHKFDKVPQNINTSEQVIVLVDEAHCSEGVLSRTWPRNDRRQRHRT